MVSKSRRGVIKHRKPNKSTRKVQIRKPLRIKRKSVSQSKGKGKGNAKGKGKSKGKGKGKGKSKGKAKKSKKRSQSKKRKLRGGTRLDAAEDDLSSSEDETTSSDEDTDDEERTLVPLRLESSEVPNDGGPLFPFPPRMDIPELDPMGQPLEPAPAATGFVQGRSALEDRLAAAGLLEPPHDPVLPLPMVPGTPMPEDPSFEDINSRLANLHIDDAQQPGPSLEEISMRLANLRIDGDRDE